MEIIHISPTDLGLPVGAGMAGRISDDFESNLRASCFRSVIANAKIFFHAPDDVLKVALHKLLDARHLVATDVAVDDWSHCLTFSTRRRLQDKCVAPE